MPFTNKAERTRWKDLNEQVTFYGIFLSNQGEGGVCDARRHVDSSCM
jgi:hypothetical protein